VELRDARLLVDRFDECVRFYTEVLGLGVRFETEAGTYAELESGPAVLSLYRRQLMEEVVGVEHRADDPWVDRVALIWRVEDVDASYEELRGRGAVFVTEPHDQETWGLRVAHLRDPEGNLIELYHPLESGPSA
jgi:catechol 2,3-dioxygenase-like lactoylglutathione lyase family enzyme